MLNFALSNGLSTWGVKFIPSGLGAIIGAMVPIWIAMISFSTENASPDWLFLELSLPLQEYV